MGNERAEAPAGRKGADPRTDRVAGLVLGGCWQPFVYFVAMFVSFGAAVSDLDHYLLSMVILWFAPGCVVLSGFLICFLSPGKLRWFCIGTALCVGLYGSCFGLLALGEESTVPRGVVVLAWLEMLGIMASVSILPAVLGYSLRRLWKLAKSVGF